MTLIEMDSRVRLSVFLSALQEYSPQTVRQKSLPAVAYERFVNAHYSDEKAISRLLTAVTTLCKSRRHCHEVKMTNCL